MHTSVLKVAVKKFRPLGSLSTTTVEMELMSKTGENPAHNKAPTDGRITLVGSYHLISKRPEPGPDGVQPKSILKFFLVSDPSPADLQEMMEGPRKKRDEFLIHGIAFSNRSQNDDDKRLGQHRFDSISVAMEDLGPLSGNKVVRVLTVTNNNMHVGKESFDYLILIQRVHDGAFGIIDPEYENEH